MRRIHTGFVLGLAFTAVLAAQTVSQTEQVARLKINRTKFADVGFGVNLRSLADTQKTDINRQINSFTTEGDCGSACPPDADQNSFRVKMATAQSDLIVVGRVTSHISALTPKNDFVVTDSEFIVSEILKAHANMVVGREITLTSAGGTVHLDGHSITSTLSNLRTFTIDGRYVLFLKFLPDSNSYTPIDLIGFDISEASVVPMSSTVEVAVLEKHLSNSTLLLNAVRSSVAHQIVDGK